MSVPSPAVPARAQAIAGGRERALDIGRGDGSRLVLAGAPAVMAILNLTPDSFFDGGRWADPARARDRARELVDEGADILDLGAESTRPGATPLSADQEWRRLEPVLLPLCESRLPVVLSVDTRHAEVARRAADAGVRLLNLPFPQHLLAPPDARRTSSTRALLERFDAVVVMHSRGTPATMREHTDYGSNLCQTVISELRHTVASLFERTHLATADRTTTEDEGAGQGETAAPAPAETVLAHDERIIYDPGLGFAKTAEQSLTLLARVASLKQALSGKLLIGASRKSMLGAITGKPTGERMVPSAVAAAFAVYHGADIVRVHDVPETVAALRLATALRQAGQGAVT